ncbi:MAG: AMP-dependent synthetase, partial [Phycisphaerales bacterium]|nr:AMP-dependent synthetase [Phycisphaerales bacterium]
MLPSGKPDRQRLLALVEEREHAPADDAASVLAAVLRREVRPTDSFASLGGDSLSYVGVSVRLERLLGTLPDDWHLRPVATLAGEPPARRRWRSVETGTVLRALAVVAIVATHSNLLDLTGGADLLLVLVGFNLGRFALASTRRSDRVRALVRSAARVAVPSVLWIGGVTLLTGQYP